MEVLNIMEKLKYVKFEKMSLKDNPEFNERLKIKLDKNSISLAGEFYVLAQLYLRGFVANLTLGKQKEVDILVLYPETGRQTKLQVKTTVKSKPVRKVRGESGEKFEWIMNKKHEDMKKNLYYCFLLIEDEKKLPKFFIVPSKEVAKYVKREHKIYLQMRKIKFSSNMRKFRVKVEGSNYKDNWQILK